MYEGLTILAPLSGKVLDLSNVPDPVFAQKMMGNGFAIEPHEGVVVAPFDAEVVNAFPTKHAIGLRAKTGLEVLIHVGMDTVTLKGEGFDLKIKEGDQVKAGDLLLEFDLDVIRSKATSIITPIVFPNASNVRVEIQMENVEKGKHEPIMLISE